ncbi:MAG: zinc-dependent alcohol dehydrogenase family protein [Thermoprotei archaeon]|nr:zinc-dependent alcohol dehydrogenase family protein [Thermoprotei archaeon]
MTDLKALVLRGVRDIRLEGVPKPEAHKGELLLKVGGCGICGTDIHFYKGEWKVKLPLIPGHEFSGIVESVGEGVKGFKPGDHVVAEPNITCGECMYCRMSSRNFFCVNLKAIGVDINGAFAEYVKVPAKNAYLIPPNMPLEEAALIEPLACCIRGLDNVGIEVGDTVAIVGTGPIGLLLIQLVRMWGAVKVYAMDLLDERLRIAKDLGADVTINPSREDPREVIMSETEGMGVDVAIEAVGSPKAIDTALNVVRRGGRLLIFGVSPQDAVWNVRPFELYDKELLICTSYRSPFTFQRAVRVAASGRIAFKPIISHVLPLERGPEIFARLDKREPGIIKVVLKP